MVPKFDGLVLSISITGSTELNRLLRELKSLEDFMTQAAVRSPGVSLKMPLTTRMLDELAKSNNLNLLKVTDRLLLIEFLQYLKKHAQTIHISFAADPSVAFSQRIVTWLRSEISPHVLLQIGLQPSIAAGCIIRTPNKYIDLSLRKKFSGQRQALELKIGAL